ncbi:MAG TPA: homoserine kinase [Terracidiphilus sp.]
MNGGPKNDPCLRLRLPATSANLGPGFDALAVALNFFLEIEAEPAADFSILATGRDAERCARLDDNLVIEAYRGLLEHQRREVVPLAIRMVNGIPLGMGCGSSAAGRLAAIALADHFGQLGWSDGQIIDEAYRLEGHPDNVAACWLGGLVSAAIQGGRVRVAQVDPPKQWRVIVVLPAHPLATSEARAVLPPAYPREDVVANIQAAALLGLAFAQGRGDLLRAAMNDRIHQPYRAPFCPLLEPLLPLVGDHGILGVALSGAGPAVLVVLEAESYVVEASEAIRIVVQNVQAAELAVCRFLPAGANVRLDGRDLVVATARNYGI